MPADNILWIIALASILIGLAVLLWLLQRERRKNKELLTVFSKLGTHNNLSFTGQEVLGDRIIGLDGRRRKLLVLESDPALRWYTVNLEEVSGCTVHKTYRMAHRQALRQHPAGSYVERVELQFHFVNSYPPLSVPFYCAQGNRTEELPRLEAKAHSWNSFLAKLLTRRHNNRA